MIGQGESYVFDGFIGSQRLLAAQIRAGQIFPKQMLAWMERHPAVIATPPARVSAPAPVRKREPVPAIILPPRETFGQRVVAHVAKRTGIPVEAITGPERCANYVVARRRVSRIMRRCGYSWNKIGRVLHRDHSTIIYYLDPKERRK